MDMSAAEVKRAASAQPQSPAPEPNGSEILVRSLQAENVKYVWGYPGGPKFLIAQVLNPPHEGAKRGTDGFSLEKITEVRDGHVCRGNQARRIGATANQRFRRRNDQRR
jgi:hypothetical protein